jgi:hypothetical protein
MSASARRKTWCARPPLCPPACWRACVAHWAVQHCTGSDIFVTRLRAPQIREADIDADGKISLDEFRRIINDCPVIGDEAPKSAPGGGDSVATTVVLAAAS